MASNNTRDLLSKLKTSLPKVEASADPPHILHRFPEPLAAEALRPVPKLARAPKLSVSLYQDDIDRLEEIKDFMKSQGFRNLSDSEALRLACRKVSIDTSLVPVYRAMQGQDGRRKQVE